MAHAHLHGTHLAAADLRRADLREATGLTADQLAGARIDATTRVPTGLAPEGV
ncbi:pentapeptide repeat-containing protein [Streptomyces sp. BR1]|uniref:pentapeptide repeat-containing protein n=1 Tax=Streptomyces sp. BR1 TaxID=1592323 RepID=UPI00402B58D4